MLRLIFSLNYHNLKYIYYIKLIHKDILEIVIIYTKQSYTFVLILIFKLSPNSSIRLKSLGDITERVRI